MLISWFSHPGTISRSLASTSSSFFRSFSSSYKDGLADTFLSGGFGGASVGIFRILLGRGSIVVNEACYDCTVDAV